MHCCTRMILTPPSANGTFSEILQPVVDVIERENGGKFKFGTTRQLIGSSVDGGVLGWVHDEMKIPYSFVFEMKLAGSTSSSMKRFLVENKPEEQVQTTLKSTLAGIKVMIDHICEEETCK